MYIYIHTYIYIYYIYIYVSTYIHNDEARLYIYPYIVRARCLDITSYHQLRSGKTFSTNII